MWKCPKCGEAVEDHFDACWNCLTPKEGTEAPVEVTTEVSRTLSDSNEKALPSQSEPPGSSAHTFPAGMLVRNIAWLENEQMISQIGGLFLTNQRVGCITGNRVSLAMLQDVDTATIGVKAPPVWFLVLGIVAVIVGIGMVSAGDELRRVGVLAILIGIGLGAAYVCGRKEVILLTVSGYPLVEMELSRFGSGAASMDEWMTQLFRLKSALRPYTTNG